MAAMATALRPRPSLRRLFLTSRAANGPTALPLLTLLALRVLIFATPLATTGRPLVAATLLSPALGAPATARTGLPVLRGLFLLLLLLRLSLLRGITLLLATTRSPPATRPAGLLLLLATVAGRLLAMVTALLLLAITLILPVGLVLTTALLGVPVLCLLLALGLLPLPVATTTASPAWATVATRALSLCRL